MPIDSTPEGGEVMHTPVNKPFPQPPEADKGGHDARDAEDSKDALANREMDGQTTIARPPLGN